MQREFAIALRARSTWLVLAVAALLVGHSFVLAVDLFSASSRSALGSLLQAREMDPLAGIVRHEAGHALGLGHSRDEKTKMFPTEMVHDIAPADRMTLRLLYSIPPGPLK